MDRFEDAESNVEAIAKKRAIPRGDLAKRPARNWFSKNLSMERLVHTE